MGVKIQWIDPNIDPLDKVEIWRSATKAGAPVKIGEVAGSVHEFQDDTLGRNKVAWYTLKSVLGATLVPSKPFPVGNFPDTGPGPTSIMRGNWEFGVFGEVSIGLLPDFVEVKDRSGIVVANNIATKFYKWVINGRIVFIPNAPYHSGLGGQTSSGVKIEIPIGKTNEDGVVIDRDGRSYCVRPPYATNNATTALTAIGTGGDETLQSTELAAIVSSIIGVDTAMAFNPLKWGDSALPAGSFSYFTNTFINANGLTLVCTFEAVPSLVQSSSLTSARGYWPVYELLMT